MAATSVVNTSLKFNKAETMPAAVAINATDGALVDYSNKEDARILLILENATAAENTVTIKAGDSIQGISDLTVTLASSETKVITVESGKYMNVSGQNRGCILITGNNANIKVAAIELP